MAFDWEAFMGSSLGSKAVPPENRALESNTYARINLHHLICPVCGQVDPGVDCEATLRRRLNASR